MEDPFPAGPDPQLTNDEEDEALQAAAYEAAVADAVAAADEPPEEEAIEGYIPRPDTPPPAMPVAAVEAEEVVLAAQLADLETLLADMEAEAAAEDAAAANAAESDAAASVPVASHAARGAAARAALADRLALTRAAVDVKAALFDAERAEAAAVAQAAQVERYVGEARAHGHHLTTEWEVAVAQGGGADRVEKLTRMLDDNARDVTAQLAALASARREWDDALFRARDMQLQAAAVADLEAAAAAEQAQATAVAAVGAASIHASEDAAAARVIAIAARTAAHRAEVAAARQAADAASIAAASRGRAAALSRLRSRVTDSAAPAAAYELSRASTLGDRTAALLALKRSISAAYDDLTASNAAQRSVVTTRKVHQAAEAAALLAAGANPYEVFRRRAKATRAARDAAAAAAAVASRESDIARRMLDEETAAAAARNAARIERGYADRFNAERGGVAQSARAAAAVGDRLITTTDRVYPSQLAVVKTPTLGSGRADPALVALLQATWKETPDPVLYPPARAEAKRNAAVTNDAVAAVAALGESVSVVALPAVPESSASGGEGATGARRAPDLARPEFPGLWDYTDSPAPVGGADDDDVGNHRRRAPPRTKLETEMLRTARAKQAAAITRPQVVCGRTFTGPPFLPSPASLVFNDFEIGRRYKRTVTLTNVSFSFNTFKVLELPDAIKDFFRVAYDFPGSLSAGMACAVSVTFEPKVNVDITTELPLLCGSGPMAIPLMCTIKRAVVSVSSTLIDLGQTALAERSLAILTIRNDGALPVDFVSADAVPPADDGEDGAPPPDWRSAAPESLAAFSFPTSGRIDGYSVREYQIAFSPPADAFPTVELFGRTTALRRDITFAFTPVGRGAPPVPPATVSLHAVVTPVPVFVPRRVCDYKTVVYGLTYRDHLVVSNRGSSALKCFLTPPRELRGMLDIAPDLLYVQAGGSATFNLKFMPQPMLESTCAEWFDPETSTLRMPLRVLVPDQVLPVVATLQARLTTSDLHISPTSLDFGTVAIGNAAHVELTITNCSDLPQKFGLTNIRAAEIAPGKGAVEVRPGHGFGTLLPRETVVRSVVWRPTAPVPCSFSLTLKTLLGRTYALPCTGGAVTLPLRLSALVLRFPATAIRDTSSLSIYAENTSKSRLTFQFVVPPGSNLKVSPLVESVAPRSRIRIQVDYAPRDEDVGHVLSLPTGDGDGEPTVIGGDDDDDYGDDNDPTAAGGQAGEDVAAAVTEPTPIDLDPAAGGDDPDNGAMGDGGGGGADGEDASGVAAPREVWSHRATSLVPCYLQGYESTPLYVEIHTAALDPELIVEGATWNDDKGYYEVNFGQVPIGHHLVKTPRLRNYGGRAVHPRADALDVAGHFSVLNAFRDIEPGDAEPFVIDFLPTATTAYFEKLVLRSPRQTVRLALLGEGVAPSLAIAEGITSLDCGDVYCGEEAGRSFTLANTSTYDLAYALHLRGGHRNLGGLAPFYCRPSEGFIPAGGTQVVTVRFGPDHEYPYYEDVIDVDIPTQKMASPCSLAITGRAWDRGLYVLGVDRPMADEEDVMAQILAAAKRKAEAAAAEDAAAAAAKGGARPPSSSKPKRPGSAGSEGLAIGEVLTVSFEGTVRPGETIKKTIEIGGLKADAGGAKPPVGDYLFDPLSKEALAAGWSIDVPKATIEPGTRKPVTFTFTPPKEVAPNSLAYFGLAEWVALTLPCVFKGGYPPNKDPKGIVVNFVLRVHVLPPAKS